MTKTSTATLQAWSIRAVNLAEHADNPVHTDVGARALGYPAAIVAGVTVYAYLTRPAAQAWGKEFLTQGGGELRLRQPVLNADLVECAIGGTRDQPVIEARSRDEVRATFEVWQTVEVPEPRPGTELPSLEFELTQSDADYGIRCGDNLSLYPDLKVAHPALWPHVANAVFSTHLVSGPWVHTRSRIYHQGLVRAGDRLRIESREVDRFHTRAGERAVVEMDMYANDQRVAFVEHEALVALTT